MKKIRHCFLILALCLSLPVGCGKRGMSAYGNKTATSGSVVVRSYPDDGLEVYIFKGLFESYRGEALGQQYLAGRTPLTADLEPGSYLLSVKCRDKKCSTQSDGDDNRIFNIKSTPLGIELQARIYEVLVKTGHQAVVTALFWHETPIELVQSSPGGATFPAGVEKWIEDRFCEHRVPESKWPGLKSLFLKTGKTVWIGSDSVGKLCIYYQELAPEKLLIVKPAHPPEEPAAKASIENNVPTGR